MRRERNGFFYVAVVGIIVWLLGGFAHAQAPPLGVTLPARVVDVYDGDTMVLDVTIRVRVRLEDCWAPEIRGVSQAVKDKGEASAAHLREIALDQPAVLFVPITGARTLGDLFSFNRIVGRVYVYDEDLSKAQVDAGHATAVRSE